MKLLNCRVAAGRRYVTSGADGFGRSDTRAVLRSFFQVDAQSIVDRILVENLIIFRGERTGIQRDPCPRLS